MVLIFWYNILILIFFSMKRLLVSLVLSLSSVTTALAAGITDQGRETAQEATTGISTFLTTIWVKAPGWIAAMVVFAASFLMAKMMKEKVVDRVSEKFGEEDKDVLILIGRSTYVAVLAVGITVALKIGGIDLTAIVAAVGFGIGFALQDIVMNFIAGILILLNRPFHIGDMISVNGTIGKVQEIQSRATILKALDGTRVIVPNADVFGNQVVNFTMNPFRRVELELGVAYGTDLGHAGRITMEAIKEHPKVLLDPAPVILWTGFGSSNIDFVARFWVDSKSNWLKTKSEVIQLIKRLYEENGIGMSYDTRTLLFSPETEAVQVPIYSAKEEEHRQIMAQRQAEEQEMAEQIEASAQRAGVPPVLTFKDAPVMPAAAVPPVEVVVPATTVVTPAVEPAVVPVVADVVVPVTERADTGANFLHNA